MNKEDLEKILKNHLLFLQGSQDGIEANLRGAYLRRADLRRADLRRADLRRANFYGANLRGANFYGANLRGANLRGAYLYGANLSGADLYGANLSGADLYGANLSGANLYGAYLYGANLSGANLCGTKGVLFFTDEKHLLVYFKTGGIYYMKIGCITKPIETWISDFKNIGRSEMYSEEHIKLYGEVIKLFSTYEITE